MTACGHGEWLTPAEAADHTGIPVATLAQWRTAPGRGPNPPIPYVKHGNAQNAPIRYRRADLDRYLTDHMVGAAI